MSDCPDVFLVFGWKLGPDLAKRALINSDLFERGLRLVFSGDRHQAFIGEILVSAQDSDGKTFSAAAAPSVAVTERLSRDVCDLGFEVLLADPPMLWVVLD